MFLSLIIVTGKTSDLLNHFSLRMPFTLLFTKLILVLSQGHKYRAFHNVHLFFSEINVNGGKIHNCSKNQNPGMLFWI